MHNKKKSESEKTPEQEALEKHVDAMMDLKQPDEPAAETESEPENDEADKPTVIDPLEATGATTAPQLSSQLQKKIGANSASAEPLKIDKLDELTESIVKEDSDKKETDSKPKKIKSDEDKPEKAASVSEKNAENDIPEDDGLDDAKTDEAVDDIMAYESDVMLAVADSTAEARSQEAEEPAPHKKHRGLSAFFWTFVALIVILAIGLGVLLVMGDSLTSKLGI